MTPPATQIPMMTAAQMVERLVFFFSTVAVAVVVAAGPVDPGGVSGSTGAIRAGSPAIAGIISAAPHLGHLARRPANLSSTLAFAAQLGQVNSSMGDPSN